MTEWTLAWVSFSMLASHILEFEGNQLPRNEAITQEKTKPEEDSVRVWLLALSTPQKPWHRWCCLAAGLGWCPDQGWGQRPASARPASPLTPLPSETGATGALMTQACCTPAVPRGPLTREMTFLLVCVMLWSGQMINENSTSDF